MLVLADRYRTSSVITLSDDKSRAAWIQVAVTGTFHSPVYGQFSITKDDLSTILRNYTNEHPVAPTELMLDYEHLSSNPTTPEHGEAAGWFKQLDLREEGTELWALVELTEDAAEKVRKKKFRYISPEIHRRYKSKRTGRDVGPTLAAAALTNRPFLEGMQPLQLSDAHGHNLGPAFMLADAAEIPYSDRERRVREAVSSRWPPAYKDGGIDWDTYTMVRDVYDDTVVFSRGAKTFRVGYAFGNDLSVTFNGEPEEVIPTYTAVVTLHEAPALTFVMESVA